MVTKKVLHWLGYTSAFKRLILEAISQF
ncbi:protein of unknown function (plasmid) [Cupriavidus taiwanensis]|uniref:Uncharacterized protein n=1 Tax=Cupriavidus taiwanensis TaxID=164546 RepID=A0A375HX26_9BURK|nr:protein of unknown function [Cupriavidus taiwanensis]SPD69396.1 protein of unknown function [Cupriavidus taiwanensis]